ncbi:MAG: phage tail-like protein [Arenicella sp.]|jgi:phage tail-like protein
MPLFGALSSHDMGVLDNINPLASAGPPLTSFHFRVDFGLPGLFVKDVGFKKVSGMNMEFLMDESKTDGTGQKLYFPNGVKFDQLVLERGMINGSYLINWMEAQLLTQKKMPIPIIVTSLDEMHLPIYSWVFLDAYPVKFETAGFDSMASGDAGILIEKITFNYWFYKQVNMSYLSAGFKAAMAAAKAAQGLI